MMMMSRKDEELKLNVPISVADSLSAMQERKKETEKSEENEKNEELWCTDSYSLSLVYAITHPMPMGHA